MIDTAVSIVADSAELAARAADTFIAVVRAAIAERGRAAVALAGGSTPRAMNALLAVEPRRDLLDWSHVRFFFGDERCVPPDHADSNYRMTRETLFDPLAIAGENIFRIAAEHEPHAAAEAYEAVLRATLGTPPVFDLIALGMGPDGHTASLFPGTLDTLDTSRTVVANYVPKFAAYRITITPPVIDAARHVLVTAGGAEKAESLAAVLTGPRDPNRFPAQLVMPQSGRREWLVDAAAAARLDAA